MFFLWEIEFPGLITVNRCVGDLQTVKVFFIWFFIVQIILLNVVVKYMISTDFSDIRWYFYYHYAYLIWFDLSFNTKATVTDLLKKNVCLSAASWR